MPTNHAQILDEMEMVDEAAERERGLMRQREDLKDISRMQSAAMRAKHFPGTLPPWGRIIERRTWLALIRLTTKRIAAARKKHPRASFAALVSEVGEVGKAIDRETLQRRDSELIDVIVVAVRLLLGEE